MGTLSRPSCSAATSRCGTGRASANGASGAASVEVMPGPYPLLAAVVCPLEVGKQRGGAAAGVGRPPVLALPDPRGILASAGGRGLQQFAAELADAGLDRVPVSEAIRATAHPVWAW